MQYSAIEAPIQAVQGFGSKSILIHHDTQSAFRDLTISPIDTPLGFQWEDAFYTQHGLPFGLRTAPYLFNLCAEVFHCILKMQIETANIGAPIINNIDDFFVSVRPRSDSQPQEI